VFGSLTIFFKFPTTPYFVNPRFPTLVCKDCSSLLVLTRPYLRSEQASLGNLGDEKFVGCGGLGEKLEKLLEPKMEKKNTKQRQKEKGTKGGKEEKEIFLRLSVYALAEGEWRAASGGALGGFISASSCCCVNYT